MPKIEWEICEATWLHVARLAFPINCLNSPLEDKQPEARVREQLLAFAQKQQEEVIFWRKNTAKYFHQQQFRTAESKFIVNEPEKWNFSSACSPSDLRLKLFTLILMLQRMLYQLLSTKLEALHVLLSIGMKATNWISMGEFPQKFSTSNSITRFWSILHRLIKLYKRKLFSDSDNWISQSS